MYFVYFVVNCIALCGWFSLRLVFNMPTATIGLDKLKVVGEASCVAGRYPDPPIDLYTHLAWTAAHPRHGSKVFTEDQAASVLEIAIAAAHPVPGARPDHDQLAARFGTTGEHIHQAIAYAIEAGFLGA